MMRDFHTLAIGDLSVKERYFLMTAAIVPRPIAFVTSYNRDKSVLNAAPFSYFNGVSTKPALIMLGVGAKKVSDELVQKDTTRNILETKEFVVNIPDVKMAEAVENSGSALPSDQSEVQTFGLETVESQMIQVPRLKNAPVQMECRLHQAIPIPADQSNSHLILGEVLCVHVREELWKDGRFDTEHMNPLSRLEAGYYGEIGRRFKMQ